VTVAVRNSDKKSASRHISHKNYDEIELVTQKPKKEKPKETIPWKRVQKGPPAPIVEPSEVKELIEKPKREGPLRQFPRPERAPEITVYDMCTDCFFCRSHRRRQAAREFYPAKTRDDLKGALTTMGVRSSIHEFADSEYQRRPLRKHAFVARHLAEICMAAAIVFLFGSASQFVSGSTSTDFAIIGGILCVCGLLFFHYSSRKQVEYVERIEEVNDFIMRYKLPVVIHQIPAGLSQKSLLASISRTKGSLV